jgi:hypothetical protein
MYKVGLPMTATGITLLTNAGHNRVLFVVASGMLVSGVVVFATSYVLSHKAKKSEA